MNALAVALKSVKTHYDTFISGVITMGWLLRLVTGGPTGKGAPTAPSS